MLSIFLVLPMAAQDDAASLTGVIQDFTGTRISGALAELRSDTGRVFRTHADDSGTYRFTGLPPDQYQLKLSSPGFKWLEVRSINIVAGSPTVLPPLILWVSSCVYNGPAIDHLQWLSSGSPVGTLRGSVLLDLGPKPKSSTPPAITDADVTLFCDNGSICGATKTDSKGEFVFDHHAPGAFRLRVTKPGFYVYEVERPFFFEISEGIESVYWAVSLERCHRRNCDPSRRSKKPIGHCE